MSYTAKDAAKDTGSSGKETARAWHSARDDASSSGELDERNDRKVSDSEGGSFLHSIFKAVFGKD